MTLPNFPNNPTLGQTFNVGNATYECTKVASGSAKAEWRVVGQADKGLRAELGEFTRTFQTKQSLQAASLTSGRCKTISYSGGWATTKEGPIGGAEYQIVSASDYRSSISNTTPSGRGDFYLANGYVAKLVNDGEPVCITKYGASPYATASVNALAIQECWNNETDCSMPAMKFVFDAQLVYPNRNFWTFTGVGEFSILEYTGPVGDWAIRSPITGDGQGGVFDLVFKKFVLKGPNGTANRKLFDCIFTRYSTFEDVFMQNAEVCLRHASNWSNTFNRCTFAPEYATFPPSGIQSVGIWLANIGAATSVSNSVNFNHCRIESARNGVLCEGGGRNISFTNGTVFEQNYRHIAIRGTQVIRSFIVTDCYMEEAYNAPLYINCPSLVGSFDGITIKNTMITCGKGADCVAALAYFEGVCPTDVSVLLEDNTIEFPSALNVPVTGQVIYSPNGTTNIALTYKTVFPPRFGDGVSFNLVHYDKTKIDFRTFNTNVPFRLDYLNDSAGNPFVAEGNQYLVALVENGVARVFGTARSATNVTTSSQAVAALPATALPTTADYFPYFNTVSLHTYGNVSSGAVYATGMGSGTGYFDFSYVLGSGIRVL